MPRAGQVKPPTDERLSDRIAIGVLTRVVPPGLVDEVVAATDAGEVRKRLLPARVVVYFVLAMCLFSGQGYEEVARLLTEGLAWARRWQGRWEVPSTAAISRARARLGAEPLRVLFDRVCRPLATEATVGAFYRGWHLVAVDGSTLDVPDTPSNVEAYGRPGSSRGPGRAAFPQVRVAALAECGTHAMFAAATGPLSVHETTLARRLFGQLRAGMLLIADRGFVGFDLWAEAAATGADLLWRVKTNMVLPVVALLPDGSYLSRIVAAGDRKRTNPATVRVVEYTLAGADTVYRLITTILDPQQAPAADLAALYAQRWEFETALDEVKTHQRGPGMVLRSRHPDGVEQEVYGFLLVHYAIRELMWQAAQHAGEDPDRISFTRTLNVIRRQVTAQAAFPPHD
ncbi:IS4 family transposase [Dactylosporangium darangshiense]|uniref:IS4 family transposase n=1 Tax=Dactylosporangium darangshiense TaxID=579108 RepID=UPI00362CA772